MNCQRARDTFAELLDQQVRPAAASVPNSPELEEARAHLAGCPDCQRDFASLTQTLTALDRLPSPSPSPLLRQKFYAMLEEEKHSAASVRAATEREFRHRRTWWLRWVLSPVAACALVGAGFITGQQFRPAPASSTTAVADADARKQLQELKAKVDRLETMNQLVAASFAQQQRPASERLNTVLTSATQEKPDDRLVTELITSLALDSSANVRLCALDALYPLSDRDVVRAAVLTSLTRESNPLVQVRMIDFLAAARDREAKPTLEKLAVNQAADGNVREAAKRALAQL